MAVGLARQDTNAGGEAFPELSLVGQFGVLDGDPASEFGRLSDLAVDDLRGIVFVVDELVHKLSAFTKEGKFLAAIGRRGQGPGELISPRAVEVSGPEVHVLDTWNHRVTRYEMGLATLRHTDATRLPTSGAFDFCLFDGDLHHLEVRAHPRRKYHPPHRPRWQRQTLFWRAVSPRGWRRACCDRHGAPRLRFG